MIPIGGAGNCATHPPPLIPRGMSEIHFFVRASFPSTETSARFYRAVRASVTEGQEGQEGQETIVDPELDWEAEDYGVDDKERFHLKAMCEGESSEVIGALTSAARRFGASSAMAILFDTETGIYQAIAAKTEGIIELYTTENHGAVGDDFIEGMKRLIAEAHQQTANVIRDGLLD